MTVLELIAELSKSDVSPQAEVHVWDKAGPRAFTPSFEKFEDGKDEVFLMIDTENDTPIME